MKARTLELAGRLESTVLARARDNGGRLPPERVLAAELGVSRGTLRRALGLLVARGLLERHVGRGTFLRGRMPRADGAAPVDAASPTEIMEARLVLEPTLAGMAALRASLGEIEAIEAAAHACGRAADLAEFERADASFHRLIATAARNRLLDGLFGTLDAARGGELWGRLKARSVTAERRALYTRQHAAIARAIRDRDAREARRATRRHLVEVARHLVGAALPFD